MFAEFVLAAITVPVLAVKPIVRTSESAAGTTAPRIRKCAAPAGEEKILEGMSAKLNDAFVAA
jgi:hypothetical protein